MRTMLLDTDFLIDLGGGRSSRRRKSALDFLEHHATGQFFISRITWAEFAEGAASLAVTRLALAGFPCLEINENTAWIASRLARELKHTGQHIGDNDVWQAAIAVEHALPLVSGNARHFALVPGLRVLSHRPPA
jgi:predicted nucleic acid-binding protein